MTKLISLLFLTSSLSAAQFCYYSDVIESTPESDFADNKDGTVTHRLTGLNWMRCSVGQVWADGSCTGDFELYNWKQALEVAENYSFAGFSDWRLPNIKELYILTEHGCYQPSINLDVFPSTPSNLHAWSSTPYMEYGAYAYFYESGSFIGRVGKESLYSVRLVRGH